MNSLHETQAQTLDDADDITNRLVTLMPARPPRNANRLKVKTHLPAILTARKNGNAWVDIADIVGMKPDALRKAVAHFTAAKSAVAPTTKKREDDSARPIDARAATEARPPANPTQNVRPPVTPAMHAGLRRKDARI